MTSDSGQREPRGRRPRLELPAVVGVDVRRVRFDQPARRNFSSDLAPTEDAVEFLVQTDGPIPIRALGPALYVGAVAVTEVSADDDTHYRFVALRSEEFADGAPITLGWTGRPGTPAADTNFRFQSPGPSAE